VAVAGLNGAAAIATGEYHTCAVMDDGSGRCWGYSYHGQLGNGEMGYATTPRSVRFDAIFHNGFDP
jgi:alpha-tubulin suppressor-like RCC1 family protein